MAFWGVLINEWHQPELLCEVIEGSDTAKLGEASPRGFGLGLLETLEEGIGRSKVLEDHWTGAAVHTAGLDEIVVGAAVDDLALDTGHLI
jgi:hypothetical protein